MSQVFQSSQFGKKFYTWKDDTYRNFMIKLLYSLEPRFIKAREVILDEFDECLEIMFVI